MNGEEKNELNSFLGKKTLRSEKESENINVKETNNSEEKQNDKNHLATKLFKVNEIVTDNKIDIKEDIASIDSLKSEDKNKEKKNDKKERKTKTKPKIKDLNSVLTETSNFIIKLSNNQNDKKNKNFNMFNILKNGFESFNDYEWDIFLYVIIKNFELNLDNYKEFQEDCSFYSYNNFRGLKLSKEFGNKYKNPPNNEKLYEESLKFSKERNSRFLEAIKKYGITLINNQPNPNNKSIHTESTRESTNITPTNSTTDNNTTKTIIVANNLNNGCPNNNKNSDINNLNNNNKYNLNNNNNNINN
jgi:hypothetical protein